RCTGIVEIAGTGMAMKARNLPVLGPHGFVDLAYWDWEGPPGAPVVLCVHGLTRNGRDFDALAEALSARFRVVCPDLPRRGKSGWLDDAAGYGFPFYLAACAALPNHPVRRLVLNDVGPFLPKEGLERIAAAIGADPALSSRDELEAYLRRTYSGFGPLSDAQWRHLAAHAGRTRSDGRLGLAFDPGLAAPFASGPIADIDFWPYYDRLQCPTL